ncbi:MULTISPECIES: DUF3299 domain-containing protein [unclassified Roseateles]|uniref:DUF3299 domain-containing protein n=1 Tax=unclassified Roseateles TaxID=2626991 RepID=UPI000701B710|nr:MULTISPECIES: DUF3299 domain-containing protein [unclassified Roseateles]KQW43603.1 hypothetical protein ASC81_17725 [Pelomonas sp. Root405]KRA71341.1 hypothetical protein ASD88_16245 [Pelomonas sp. Root662]
MKFKPLVAVSALLALSLASAAAVAQVPPVVGQGAGYHDPRSAFKPLEDRADVVSWKLLSQVTAKAEKKKIVPTFPAAVQALDRKTVKVQGFMMPLEAGDKQQHFLLSAVPTSCSFCVPAGPEGLVEVRTKKPVRYTLEPVVVEGVLAVLNDDPYGLYYRVEDGNAVN